MISVKVTRRQPGGDILDRIEQALDGPKTVAVGFPQDQAEGGIIERAIYNEFGTSRGIPERSFFRNAMQENRAAYRSLMRSEAKKIMRGEGTTRRALERLGIASQGHIQQSIVDLRSPANSPATVAAKGSSNPLIDTGEMRAAVTFIVET